MKHYFTYLLLTVSFFSFSQQNKFLDKFSLGMNFKLPKTIENTTFRKTIYGVGDIELNFNFKLAPNFEISLGHKYGYYDINSLAFQENIEGKMEMLNPFLEFSYINSLSNSVFFDIGIKGGYNISFTSSTNCSDRYTQNSYRIEPELGIYMLSSDLLSFGLIFSYNIWFAEFGPEHLCMTSISGMNASESRGFYQTFCAGLGFKTYLPSKTN